jgi:quercetin dioxygenase-like cupin family protein
LEASSQTIILHGGDWVYLERGERHGLNATEDSSLLLTILFDERQ